MPRPPAESVTLGRDLSGLRAVVTGASSGLGMECARVLALRGASVVLACRTPDKGEAAKAAFVERHGAAVGARCVVEPFDGDRLGGVDELADRLGRGGPVDRLFLNAGTFGQPFRLTPEGHEATYAANYLAHFLLVHRLLAARALAPDARVLATLSEGVTANPFAKADIEMLSRPDRARYSTTMASPHTKVLLALLLVELARRVRGTSLAGVRAVGVLPPPTRTNNVNTGGAMTRFAARFISPMFRPVEEGAACMLAAATATAGESSPREGAIDLRGPEVVFVDAGLRMRSVSRRASDPDAAARAWAASETALGLSDAEGASSG